MNITSVQVTRPKNRKSPILAFAVVAMNNGLELRDLRLVENQKTHEPLLLMPVIVTKSGKEQTLMNPLNSETRKMLTDAVVDVYNQAVTQDINYLEYISGDAPPSYLPEVTDIQVHRFRENRQLKGVATCVLDGSIILRRIAIVLNPETQEFSMVMPRRNNLYTKGVVNYFRLSKEVFDHLYTKVLNVYTAS